MIDYTLTFFKVSEQTPLDDKIKVVLTETKSGRVDFNRAWFDGRTWHGSGSMSGVTHWAELNAADVLIEELRRMK